MNYKSKNRKEQNLIKALSKTTKEVDLANFMRDLLTTAEIAEFATRLEVARLLETSKLSYREIANAVGVSTTTVSRVSLWLKDGCEGYKKALKNLQT